MKKTSQWSKPTKDFWNDTVLQNLDYARHLIGHKINLGTAGVKIGLSPGKILAHDWSKFKPRKFDVYEDFFYGPEGRRGKLSKDVYTAFRKEVEDHYRTEAHHRHKLGLPEDPQTQMESVVDWYSVGKTNADMRGIDFPNFLEWWEARKYGFLVKGAITKDTFVKIEQAIAKNYNIVTYTIDKLRSLFK